MTERNPEDELAAELAREVVARAAPHELPIFRATSKAYLADPDRAFQKATKDEMLGFGVESVAVLTPFALAVAKSVVGMLMGEVAKQVTERSTDAAVGWVRRLLGRREEPGSGGGDVQSATLTPEQLSRVRELALDKARDLDLDEEKAALLADAMVGSLVLRPA